MATADKKKLSAESIAAHVADLQQQFAAFEAKINPLKEKRDAFIAKNRVVYDTERKMANEIKALQEQAVPIAMEIKRIKKLIVGG